MTEEEFLAIWQNSVTAPPVEIEYRLYHDGDGFPLFYSTEDLPGLYIKIDQQTFLSGPKHIRVIDGKIVESKIAWTKKLIPATQGRSCHPLDVCVIVGDSEPHTSWRMKHKEPNYDTKN